MATRSRRPGFHQLYRLGILTLRPHIQTRILGATLTTK
jgi:hypothetical protein